MTPAPRPTVTDLLRRSSLPPWMEGLTAELDRLTPREQLLAAARIRQAYRDLGRER